LHFPDDFDFTEGVLGADAGAGGCEDADVGGCKDAKAGGCENAKGGGAKDKDVVETDRIESEDEAVAGNWPSKGRDDVDGRAGSSTSIKVKLSCGAGKTILAEDKGAACPVSLTLPFPSIERLEGAWAVPLCAN
jgi:hypothetical protein